MSNGIRIIKAMVSFMSAIMLAMQLSAKANDFYAGVFIFLANPLIDIVFSRKQTYPHNCFPVWTFINMIGGMLACAFSFFLQLRTKMEWATWVWIVNIGLFVIALSYVMRDMGLGVYTYAKENDIFKKKEL